MKKIQKIELIHINCFTATIDGEYVVNFEECSNRILISLSKDYKSDTFGMVRWSSIKPFDKDEIVSIRILYSDSVIFLNVPFKQVSNSGSYSINDKSSIFEDEAIVTITWSK